MKITKFSKKQKQILNFMFEDYQALICDGSVRSGKTLVMTFGFITWAMANFDGTNFAICSKTVTNAERNILRPFQQVEYPAKITYKVSNRMITVKVGSRENYFYLFGGKDESSYMLVQGITLAGVLFDEVALMPQSFVDQAIARTVSFGNAKLWFNCNPESPNHWFYKEWLLKHEKKKAKHIHFLMEDNPILGEKEIKKAKAMFSGVFYDRYILGLWKVSDGLIYPLFAENPGRYSIDKKDVPQLSYIYIGEDFGGNGSNHAYVATGLTNNMDTLYLLKSKSVPAPGTSVEDITKHLKDFAEAIEKEYGFIDLIFADSAEQAIINTQRQRLKYNITNSIKNEIIDRIRCTDILLSSDRIKIVAGENDALIDGLKNAVWDSKSIAKDKRLDNGTSNIDILDAFEYSWERYIKQLLIGCDKNCGNK